VTLALIDEELGAFLEGQVMIVVGACDADRRPLIARSMGAHLAKDRSSLDLYLSRRQWPEVAGVLIPGAPVSVTFSCPSDYRTYQVKGIVEGATALLQKEREMAARYVESIAELLSELGVPPQQLRQMLTCTELGRVRMRPNAVFGQTPGPGAGSLLGRTCA
jgi:hypothetical protein